MPEEEIQSYSMSEIPSKENKSHQEMASKSTDKPKSPGFSIELTFSKNKKATENKEELLKPGEESSVGPSSVGPSQIPSTSSKKSEDEGLPPVNTSADKDKGLSKVSSKSVHLILDNGKNGSQVVEPQKDPTMHPDFPEKPPIDGVPVVGTYDSLELQGKSPQVSEKQLEDEDAKNVCTCDYKDYWEQLDKLKKENKMLREGSEIQRLKDEVEEKMRRILELNEENRTLNDMINMLRTNQTTKKQKEPPSDSEPMSSDSDYCTGVCEQSRVPVKASSAKRRLTCREKCGHAKDTPDPSQMSRKLCVCQEDTEKGNESPPCIDVYKREDKGKFISDSSSTVCNEEVCPFLKGNFALYDNKERVRGGNDSNQQCPAGTFPNFQYNDVMDECFDSTCPNKDNPPITQAIDTNAVNCDVNDIALMCGNVSCQTDGCREFEGDLESPNLQCVKDSCLNPTCKDEEQEIGIADFGLECNDETCPNRDTYQPPISGGMDIKDSPQIQPTDSLTPQIPEQVLSCHPSAVPTGPGETLGVRIDCTCVNMGTYPVQVDPNCPCMRNAGIRTDIPIQIECVPGASKTPSICICRIPSECQRDVPTIDNLNAAAGVASPFITPSAPPASYENKASNAMENEYEICAICGCRLTSSDVLKGHACDKAVNVIPPTIEAATSARVMPPENITTFGEAIAIKPMNENKIIPRSLVPSDPHGVLTGTTPKLGPRTSDPCPDEFCKEPCTCKITPSEPYFDPDEPRPPLVKAENSPADGGEPSVPCEPCVCEDQVGTAMSEHPSTALSKKSSGVTEKTSTVEGEKVVIPEKPSEVAPFVDREPTEIPTAQISEKSSAVVDDKPSIHVDEKPSAVVSEIPSGGCSATSLEEIDEKPSAVMKEEPSAVMSEKPSELMKEEPSAVMSEKPSEVIKEEPSAVMSEKPSEVMKEKPSAVMSEKPSALMSEKPSALVDEKPSVMSGKPSTVVSDKPIEMTEKPSAVVGEKPSKHIGRLVIGKTDNICDDSTCDKRFPNNETGGGVIESSKRVPPPIGGDDRIIIRCICKSKFCKIIPDPDNPNQRLCVDSSDTNIKRKPSSCVCLPSCPNPGNPEEVCPPCEDTHNYVSKAMEGSRYPKETTVLTVNQLYIMPKTPGSLSKEQEYAGLSLKDNATKKSGYIAPRKASGRYGIQDGDNEELTGNDESKNADLKLVIADLKSKLLDAEDKIDELKIGKNYTDKDNDTALITKYCEEINQMKKSLKWTKKEREEYEYLKQRVKLLEQGKGDTDNITTNLQTAVDLYVDTIELLEVSEQKLKAEIEQYRGLNEALHENILSMRQEIEDMKKKFQQEIDDQKWMNFILHIDNVDIQHTNQMYSEQIKKYQNLYQQLMELNYELETEHVNNLQDLSMMEAQFNKYQSLYKIQEDEKIVIKNQLKKLTKKNKCYEEVVQFFKEEMSVMSDELLTLQEVLNVTNVSSQEENNKLIGAILQLRRINDRLVGHLCAIEKQVVLENQINQINEARINELQNIISAKNNDLTQHDDIIQDMRRKLNNATRQNADLKNTIKNLTDTVVEIQEGIKSVERDQVKNLNNVSVVESKVCLANGDLESIKTCMELKNGRIVELENQLKSQEVDLILATKELGMLKEKKADSKEIINSLKEQLSIAEKKNQQIIGDYQAVVKKLQDFSSLEHMKNYELNHYKSLVEEMKISLVQLNNGLEKCEASNIHFYEDLRNSVHLRGRLQHRENNLPIVFDELKKSMADLKKRLSDADFKGGLIEEELLKVKESHMSKISEEVTDSQKELEAKIISSIEEQSRLNQLVEEQKDEIQRLKRELEKEKADVCCCKRSVSELKNEKTSSNAQMEISHLKCELNKSIHRQKLLNEENDQIHTEMINLRKKLTVLEQAYDVLKQENEEYKLQLKRTTREKEYLSHKNHDLTKTIEQMRSTHDQLEKQCRYNNDCIRNLELELSETQTEKETVSSEAQNLVSVVKMWLQEQNVVNGEIRGKFQSYSDTITSLRQTMMKKMSEERSWIKTPMQQPFSQRRYGTMANLDRRATSPVRTRRLERHTADARYGTSSPWRDLSSYMTDEYLAEDTNSHRSNMVRNISYDSNSSPYTSRSPSPRSNSMHGEEDEFDEMNLNDWFSPNYKETDTDADEGEEDAFINKLHLMTAQVQEANKRWQKKMNKEHLSKSRPSNK